MAPEKNMKRMSGKLAARNACVTVLTSAPTTRPAPTTDRLVMAQVSTATQSGPWLWKPMATAVPNVSSTAVTPTSTGPGPDGSR